jgi:hypothetical protein
VHLKTLSPYKWSVVFHAPSAALPQDVTAQLSDAASLTPSFVANSIGVYVVTLSSQYGSYGIRIDSVSRGIAWVPLGPFGYTTNSSAPSAMFQGSAYNVGRINDIAFDAHRPGTIYAASSQGGVFRSLDSGASWWPISDHIDTPAEEASALHMGGDGNLYVGFGGNEDDRTGFDEGSSGLYRFSPETLQWSAVEGIAFGCPNGLVSNTTGRPERIISSGPIRGVIPGRGGGQVIRPFELVVATASGLYWSNDNGQCWHTLISDFVTDVAYDPTDSDNLVVATHSSGLLQVASFRTMATIGAGFKPYSFSPTVSRLAISGTRVYATSSRYGRGLESQGQFEASDDGGQSWSVTGSAPCGQCAWWPALTVDPVDPSRLLYGDVGFYVSTDGATTFTEEKIPGSHADYHTLAFAPWNPNTLWASNDGGVYSVSVDPGPTRALGGPWIARNTYLQSNQSATLAIAPAVSGTTALGSWDNGTFERIAGREWWWSTPGTGDGEIVAIDADATSEVYTFQNAFSGSTIVRLSDFRTLGVAPGFAANPYVPGELWLLGAQADQGLYGISSADSSNSPTLHCILANPTASASAYSLAFTSSGYVFVGYWDGSVVRLQVPNMSAGSSSCTKGTAAATDVETVAPAAVTTGQGVGLATRADADDSIIASSPGLTGANVIARWDRSPVDGTWSSTALAATLSALAADFLTTPVVYDDATGGRLFVGTTRGVWEGDPDASGNYSWTQNLDFPDTWVSTLVRHKALAGSSGDLRASTYGRGVWERRWFPTACEVVHCDRLILPVPRCLTCRTQRLTTRATGLMMSMQMSVPIERAVSGETLRHPCPGVVAHTRVWSPETGLAVAEVTLAGRSAPLGLLVDELQSTVLGVSGRPVRKIPVYRTRLALRREDARILRLASIEESASPAVLRTRLTPRIADHGTLIRLGDGIYAAPAGSRLVIEAPQRSESERLFKGWKATPALAAEAKRNAFSLVLREDTEVVAVYEGKPEHE